MTVDVLQMWFSMVIFAYFSILNLWCAIYVEGTCLPISLYFIFMIFVQIKRGSPAIYCVGHGKCTSNLLVSSLKATVEPFFLVVLCCCSSERN